MKVTPQLKPHTPAQYLRGVGPHLARLLQKKSVYTAWDLLFYLPVKYVDHRSLHSIHSLPADKKQTFIGTVQSMAVRPLRGARKRLLEMLVADKTGAIKVVFFQFNESWLRKRFPAGTTVLFFGDVRPYGGLKTMVHPEMEIWDDDADAHLKIYPFYSLTDGLYQKTLRNIVNKNLDELIALVRDEPRSVRDAGVVQVSLAEALKFVHHPPLHADIEQLNQQKSPHHQRIIYDEFFYLQLGLISRRYQQAHKQTEVIVNEQILYQRAVKNLPFELTGDQKKVLEDIKNDFASGHPMNRLLQGDVGCGKTMVAFLSSLFAIESGFQACLMAPTEILAEQHFKNLIGFEDKLNIRIDLLTGSTGAKKRAQVLSDLEQGVVNLLVGTHALIEPDVQFHRLGYVIIDEQHRFGVLQRAQLKNKTKFKDGQATPHILFMTATPIPRSLSMCVYGDLDLSIIREMPRGRKPVVTRVFRERHRAHMYDLVRQELKGGRQAYFVYPLIEESEKMDLKDATRMYEKLGGEFSEYGAALLHGRLKPVEKEAVMQKYKAGQIHILVSTTVVEVGVDVPNSTVMVIEHAERFGLSQLHQLRGRVGRGSERSFCFLLASYAQSLESRYRLKIMEETGDGFRIAEEDLKIRGPGEFLGTRQSGMPDLRLAQIIRDNHLLTAAKKRAEEILKNDPALSADKNHLMREIMLERWGKRLDLSLV